MTQFLLRVLREERLPRWSVGPIVGTFMVARDMQRADVFRHASAMAYVTLLSIVPSLAAVFALVSLFKPLLGHDNVWAQKGREFVLGHLAAGSGQQVVSYLETFLANLDLTQIGVSGLAGLLVSLILLLKQIELALNRIWEVQKPRALLRRFVYFWTFLTLGALVLGLSLGIWSSIKLQSFAALGSNLIDTYTPGLLARGAPLVATWIFFFLLFKVVPNCLVKLRPALLGSAVATVLFVLGSDLYGFYVAHLASYQAIYGAFAALPLFLLWLYISWIIILLGAVVSRRNQDGVDPAEFISGFETRDPSPDEQMRHAQIQVLLPLWLVLLAHDIYQRGDPQGLLPARAARMLNLPLVWVRRALEQAVALKVMIRVREPGGENAEDSEESESSYYPAIAASQVRVSNLLVDGTRGLREWLVEHNRLWPVDLMHASAQALATGALAVQEHATEGSTRRPSPSGSESRAVLADLVRVPSAKSS